MNYNLIHDEKQINIFENMFFSKSNLTNQNVFLSCLISKTKQSSNVFEDCLTKNIIIYDNNEEGKLLNIVNDYQFPLSYYKNIANQKYIPKQFISVHASINPRNTKDATHSLTNEIINEAFSNRVNFSRLGEVYTDKLMKFKFNNFIGVVANTKSKIIISNIINDINTYGKIYTIIEHKYGYSIIIKKNLLQNETENITIFRKLELALSQKYNDVKISFDIFCPIPGTYEDEFPVKFAA